MSWSRRLTVCVIHIPFSMSGSSNLQLRLSVSDPSVIEGIIPQVLNRAMAISRSGIGQQVELCGKTDPSVCLSQLWEFEFAGLPRAGLQYACQRHNSVSSRTHRRHERVPRAASLHQPAASNNPVSEPHHKYKHTITGQRLDSLVKINKTKSDRHEFCPSSVWNQSYLCQ